MGVSCCRGTDRRGMCPCRAASIKGAARARACSRGSAAVPRALSGQPDASAAPRRPMQPLCSGAATHRREPLPRLASRWCRTAGGSARSGSPGWSPPAQWAAPAAPRLPARGERAGAARSRWVGHARAWLPPGSPTGRGLPGVHSPGGKPVCSRSRCAVSCASSSALTRVIPCIDSASQSRCRQAGSAQGGGVSSHSAAIRLAAAAGTRQSKQPGKSSAVQQTHLVHTHRHRRCDHRPVRCVCLKALPARAHL